MIIAGASAYPRDWDYARMRKICDAPHYAYEDAINQALFPALQGGPHNHQIAGLATQLKEVCTPEFKAYIKQVKANAAALCDFLVSKGQKLATNGTENHLMLWDLRPHGLSGNKVEKVLEKVHITLNKNAVHGDVSAMSPGGVRIGAPAMTTRGLKEADFVKIGEFLLKALETKEMEEKLAALRTEVETFAGGFFVPG